MTTEPLDCALRARLEAAERVCVLVGWTPPFDDSDISKALLQLWLDWSRLPGVKTGPADHRELGDSQIAELGFSIPGLARRRDETRAEVLERIRTEYPGLLPAEATPPPTEAREGTP